MAKQITLDMMKNSKEITCESCGNDTFDEVLKLRLVIKEDTEEEKDTLVPISMFACRKCGYINKDFDASIL